MISGGNSFNDVPEIVPTREITSPKQRRLFSFPRPWLWAYFLNGPNAAASIAPRRCLSVGSLPGGMEPACIYRRIYIALKCLCEVVYMQLSTLAVLCLSSIQCSAGRVIVYSLQTHCQLPSHLNKYRLAQATVEHVGYYYYYYFIRVKKCV